MNQEKYPKDKYCFFEILNLVNQKFSTSDVEEQFKKYGSLSHPDKITTEKEIAQKRFFNICLAYFVLSDKTAANIYSEYRNSVHANSEYIAPPKQLEDMISELSEKALKITEKTFKNFIIYLKNDLKIISDLNAQTAIGLYYEFLEVEHDKKTFELYIDPEEIKPKVSLALDILFSYIKIISLILVVYAIFYIIAYIRL